MRFVVVLLINVMCIDFAMSDQRETKIFQKSELRNLPKGRNEHK